MHFFANLPLLHSTLGSPTKGITYLIGQVGLNFIVKNFFHLFFKMIQIEIGGKMRHFLPISVSLPAVRPMPFHDFTRLLFFRHIPLSATLYKILVMDFHTWWRYHYFCFTGTAQQSTLSTYFVFGELSDDC